MYKHRARWGLALAALFASASALAGGDRGGYVGFGIGRAQQEVTGFFDESDTAFKIFGGYAFNRYFAAELSYLDGGSPERRDGDSTLRVDSQGLVPSVIASLPLGERFALFGRLGYAFSESSVKLTTPTEILTEAGDDEDLLYGFGASARFNEHFGVQLDFEALDLSEGSFEVFSLSATYRF